MTVKMILARKGSDVAVIEPTARLSDAIRQLAERGIGALVIVGADRRIIGILSERDIVRTLSKFGASALEQPVAQVMTRNVMTCTLDETVARVMGRMTTGKFRHLPVLEDDRLAGIVSIGDVVKIRVQEVERESEALRDYIRTA